jgi:6-phosphogluconolactonase
VSLIRPGGEVLDVACGGGRHARHLAKLAFEVEAVDRDASLFADPPAGVSVREADLETGPWPYAGRRFDGIVVANYNKGVFARYFLSAKGEIQTPEFFTNKGSGPNKSRQDASHAHYIGETEKNLFACDLGTDEVLVFKKGSLTNPTRFKTAPGAGPRHAAFDATRNVLFVNNELNCTVSALKFDDNKGTLKELNTLSTLPAGTDLKGNSTAEIRVFQNKFVYVSNRGHHSIASYAIQKDGKLKLIEITPAGVKTPRGMNIDPSGNWLLVAGQDDNVIKSFRINAKTGKLKPSGFSLAVSKPVDIAF